MTHHALKSWPEYFSIQTKGDLEMTVRKNDRDYQINDSAQFFEYDTSKGYTGKKSPVFRIKYILSRSEGLMDGYVILLMDGPWARRES